MSTYVFRNVEVRRPLYKKRVSKLEDIDIERDQIKEGDYVKTWCEKDFNNFVYRDGKWVGVTYDDVPHKWILCENWYESDDYEKEDNVVKTNDGRTLVSCTGFVDNGGAIRDEYLSRYGGEDYGINERGWPSDASEEFKERHKDEQYIWGKTYVGLDEWESLYEREKLKFKENVAKVVRKESFDKIDQRFDYIEEMIKFDRGQTIRLPEKPWVNKEKDVDEYDDSYYDSIEYLFDEDHWDLTCILREITRAYHMVEIKYGYVDYKDIRILYFMG